jgi:4'-phosphopantetheinyl transferase
VVWWITKFWLLNISEAFIWKVPPETVLLSAGELHVWRFPLEVDKNLYQRYWQYLSADEQQRAQRFVFEKDRVQSVVSRGVLRSLLGLYLKCPADSVALSATALGKPFCRDHVLPFNVSHSHGWAVVVVGQVESLGVDIEWVQPDLDWQPLSSRFFSAAEHQQLLRQPATQQRNAFFCCWTRKEAVVKAIGEGLFFALQNFEVSVSPDQPARLLAVKDQSELVDQLGLISGWLTESYPLCVAVGGEVKALRAYEWCHVT